MTVGDATDVIATATWAMTAVRRIKRRAAANLKPLAETLKDALRLLCATPVLTASH